MYTATLKAKDQAAPRIRAAFRAAYGPALDPRRQMSDDALVQAGLTAHAAQLVSDLETTQHAATFKAQPI